jgi:hypothetical protein
MAWKAPRSFGIEGDTYLILTVQRAHGLSGDDKVPDKLSGQVQLRLWKVIRGTQMHATNHLQNNTN